MSEIQIAEIWNEINQIFELNVGRFSIKLLQTRKWYLQVLQIVYPLLNDKLNKILQIQSEEVAIDRMILLLTQEEIIEDDFLDIKGKDIVNGDVGSIYYAVQLFNALVQRALEEAEGEQGTEDPEESQEQSQRLKERRQDIAFHKELVPSQQQKSHPPSKMAAIDLKSKLPGRQNQRECHSVQGIGHQFEDDEQDQQQQNDNRQDEWKTLEKMYDDVLPETKKQNNSPNMRETNSKNEEQEQFDENYLKQRLQKHKSEQLFKNVQKKQQKKSQVKKEVRKIKKLVTHPHIQKTYPKASTLQEKKLSQMVKKTVKTISGKYKENIGVMKLVGSEQIDKKKRELNYYLGGTRKSLKHNHKDKIVGLKIKNDEKLKKLLNWKEANLRRQKKQLELEMESKVQLKKQLYVKKINQLILGLQKDRMIELKKEEIEREKREKQLAHRRLEAIQQQYKTQMKLIREKSEDKLKKKGVIHTDHRAIIQGLERELKRQNDKQIIDLKMKFRREQAQLQDDLQQLQSEIIRAYKRN